MKQTDIAQLLPGIFQRTLGDQNPLSALLAVMEALHEPDEDVLDQLDTYFDPYRAPDRFVPYLAGWVDLERLLVESPEEREQTAAAPLPTGMGRLRELIAAAAYLSQWRGTARGLQRFLETATGVHGFEIDESGETAAGRRRAFHIRIRAPKATEPFRVLLDRIIEIEKPAYVTYEIEFIGG